MAAGRQAAGRVRTDHCDRVRSAARAGRVCLDVRRSEVGRRNGCTGVELRFHGVLLLGRVDLLQVGDTGILSAGRSCLNEVRHGDGHENADDQHDDHDFNKGETLRFSISNHYFVHVLPERGYLTPQLTA